jgi:hypothetical protein
MSRDIVRVGLTATPVSHHQARYSCCSLARP